MHVTDFTLNEYLDNELEPQEQDAVRAHLARCSTCRALVSELDAVKQSAAALEAIVPPSRAWGRLDDAIRATGEPGRGWASAGSFGPLAAAAALLLITLVGVRFGPLSRGSSAPTLSSVRVEGGLSDPQAPAIEAELQQSEAQYQNAIVGLQQIANDQQDTLDAQTVVTLWEGFAVVDRAIGESRAALKLEPESRPAQESLLNGLKTKMALLEDTVALINAARKSREG